MSEAPQQPSRFSAFNLRSDALSGFLVFLIALPLCLAIAKASGFPPIAGVFTAIIGGFITPWISNSEMTIKGPAAGLIVIVVGCMVDFGFVEGGDPIKNAEAYRMVLAVGLAAGVIQVALGLMRAGALGEFFPSAAVHGLLAAIGVIIIAKQVPLALGVSAKGEPLELLAKIPEEVMNMNPEIALIGGVSLLILFLLPFAKNPLVRRIPGPMLVLLVAVPLGLYFDLAHEHTYSMWGHNFKIDENYLVKVPDKLLGALTLPDFSALAQPVAWKWVFMFAMIGSLESMLSAKAIDLIDPQKRKTDQNRDLLAVGLGNTVAALAGGLPMISEIVRSRANIDNGARTRMANAFHALFLLGAVLLLPAMIHRIPLAALGAMLVFTGFRLASPKEFLNIYKVGREQLAVFVTTIVAVLATDLLVGIAIGIALEFIIQFVNGVSILTIFKPTVDIEIRDEKTAVLKARSSTVFTNWIPFKRRIENCGVLEGRNVILDLSDTHFVDHTVMAKLHELRRDFERSDLKLDVIGLDDHRPFSKHPEAGRKRNKNSTHLNSTHRAPEPEPVSSAP